MHRIYTGPKEKDSFYPLLSVRFINKYISKQIKWKEETTTMLLRGKEHRVCVSNLDQEVFIWWSTSSRVETTSGSSSQAVKRFLGWHITSVVVCCVWCHNNHIASIFCSSVVVVVHNFNDFLCSDNVVCLPNNIIMDIFDMKLLQCWAAACSEWISKMDNT